jgi:phosphatidyl-myo-inositol dimannoside synthase
VALLDPANCRPTLRTKIRFIHKLRRELTRRGGNAGPIIIGHPSLALVAAAVGSRRRAGTSGAFVICYGEDIWGQSKIARTLLRHLHLRIVTISSFSAGTLAPIGRAAVVAPGVNESFRQLLLSVERQPLEDGQVRVLSVFRLADAQNKGLPALVEALDMLTRSGMPARLTVAGAGCLPADLAVELARRPWAQVVSNASDQQLARLYGDADLFVLATRVRLRRPTSGEGFGLVLLEAQLAGLPVVAPAYGGSDDAFVYGFTGLKPIDESPAALAAAIRSIAGDDLLRAGLSSNARWWAKEVTDPERCRLRAAKVFSA